MTKQRSIVDQTLSDTLFWGILILAVIWGIYWFFNDRWPSRADESVALVVLAYFWVHSTLSALEKKQEEQYQELAERIDSLPDDLAHRAPAEGSEPRPF